MRRPTPSTSRWQGPFRRPCSSLFQLMFAIITVALISGAVADRLKFGGWLLFAGLWATFVYFPVAHWVFAFDGFTGEHGGWIANKLKAIDFAGGTAVHINSGAAGLALAIVLGKRMGWPTTPMRPHNLPFVMLGAGLLWFGWYGFNAGSATVVQRCRRRRRSSPPRSPPRPRCSAGCSTERIRDGKATSLGAASGIVAGLVAITPSCSSVNVLGALVDRRRSPACLRAGRRPEIQVRLRRLARRGRRAPGRRSVRHAAGRLRCATARRPAAVTGLFYGGGFDQLGVRPSARSRFWPTRSSSPLSWP